MTLDDFKLLRKYDIITDKGGGEITVGGGVICSDDGWEVEDEYGNYWSFDTVDKKVGRVPITERLAKFTERDARYESPDIKDCVYELMESEEEIEQKRGFKSGMDSDMILCEKIEKSISLSASGLAHDVMRAYLNSNDKYSVAELFYSLTGTEISDFFMECAKNLEDNMADKEISKGEER